MTLVLAWVRAHLAPVAIAAALVVLLVFGICRGRKTPLPPREQKSKDSLEVTSAPFDSAQLRRAKAETVYVTKSAQEARRGVASLASADSLRTIANRLQVRAEATGDTLSQWRAVALARGAEADTLRAALSTTTHALDLQILGRLAVDSSLTEERRRRVAIEDLSNRLAVDVQKAGGGFFTKLRARIGVSCGYGVTAAMTGSITHGPACLAGIKVFP